MDIVIRPIKPSDNADLARIIRNALKEHGADKPNTVFTDPTTDQLYKLFAEMKRSAYFTALIDGVVVGGGGIYPSNGLDQDTVELVKMYLKPEIRGAGIGKTLLSKCLDEAKLLAYKTMYIESMPELSRAVAIYEKLGFKYLDGPMGNTGHSGCGIWMKKAI